MSEQHVSFLWQLTSPMNMEAAAHAASGLQQGFWQHLMCYFHKQFRKKCVFRTSLQWCIQLIEKTYSKLITVKLEQCIKWYLQEFVQSPTVFNSVINYLHDAIYGIVIKDHVTVGGAATVLHYQKINQNGLGKSGGEPTEWFSSYLF